MNELYTFVKEKLLSDFKITINPYRGKSIQLEAFEEELDGQRAVLTFDSAEGLKSLKLYAELLEDSVVFSVDAELAVHIGGVSGFASEDALTLELGPASPDALLGSHHDNGFWMYPSFLSKFEDILPRTQSLIVRSGDSSYHLLPLTGDNFRCEFEKGKLKITSDMLGLCRLRGAFLSVSVSKEPISAVKNNYLAARTVGAIRVPLKNERTRPEFFEGFGWCTWDAFYTDVSSEQIYAKLAEFKSLGIPVKWVVIDDGWMTTRDSRLSAFEVDRKKFPEGLGATVSRMKREFGVERVGIWHAFNGYWLGIDRDSTLYEEQRDNLFITPADLALPSLDEDKAFAFWDSWHTYLEASGIDFLKVDNQSSNPCYLVGAVPTAEGCRIAHRAIERSIEKHFRGAVINCMGMDMENTLARPHSAVSRNSDDFFPNKERGFIKHLIQNAYNAIWHDNLYYCDFDMWWSNHGESAVQSGVLRAISGSPIYVSDKLGETSKENILPVLDGDGTLMLCDGACMPTSDCVFVDCIAEHKHLKVYNRSGESFALAAFNVNEDEVCDTVDFSQLLGLSADVEYVAYEFFTKTYTRVGVASKTELTLPKDGVAVWSLEPIICSDEGEYVMLGNPDKYVSIASKFKKKASVSEIIF